MKRFIIMKNIFKIDISKGIQSIIVSMIVLLVGASLIRSFSHQLRPISSHVISEHRGMLGNIIGGLVAILVGTSLIGTISQEMNNAFCDSNESHSIVNYSSYIIKESPNGATDSFGGGGAEHFGGYTGEVKHKNWMSNLAPIKTEKSLFFSDNNCIDPNSAGATILGLVPMFFALVILFVAFAMVFTQLRNTGMV